MATAKEGTPSMGRNRTGMQMSPQDSQELLEIANALSSSEPQASVALREQYISEAEPLGSVPMPGSIKGAMVTGAKLMQGKHPQLFIDKLAERLAFERGGARLYEALINKFRASEPKADRLGLSLDELIEIRDDEAEHFHLVSECIQSLGGDPTAQTPGADRVGVESMGLMQTVSDPRTNFAESLHALLVAELTDVDAWQLLADMAEMLGNADMAERFRMALQEEQTHLTKVRHWYQQLSLEAAGG